VKNSGPSKQQQNSRPGPGRSAVVSKISTRFAAGSGKGSTSPTRQQLEYSKNSLEPLKQLVDIEELEANIKQSPDINASRVVNLHHRIEAGEYEIDSTRLAEKMIAFESELD
jgi:flagellar biosynthesis anti-sigma factor FlgM